MTKFCVVTHNVHPAQFVPTSSHHLWKGWSFWWLYDAIFIKMRKLVQDAFREREQNMLPAVCCSLSHHWMNYNFCTAAAKSDAVLLTMFIALVDGMPFCLLFSSFMVLHGLLMDLPIIGTELDSLNSYITSLQQCLKMEHTHYWSLPATSLPCQQLLDMNLKLDLYYSLINRSG